MKLTFPQKNIIQAYIITGWSVMMNEENNSKRINKPLKKSPEELAQWLHFNRRGTKVPAKKGRGSFRRDEKVKFDF